MFYFSGKLTHDEKSTHDADAGFATVEESSVGLKQVNRGRYVKSK